jgi:hypothetical protein
VTRFAAKAVSIQMACFSTPPWRSCACCESFLYVTGTTTPSSIRASSVTCSKHAPRSAWPPLPPSNHLPFYPMEVVKGGSQKVDNAAVPDQLWLQAFLGGYGDPGCLVRHRFALGLGNCWAGGMTGGEGPPPGWQAAMPGFRELGLRFW